MKIKFEGISIHGITVYPKNELEFWKARSEVERATHTRCLMGTCEVPADWYDNAPEFHRITVMVTNRKIVERIDKFCTENKIDHHTIM